MTIDHATAKHSGRRIKVEIWVNDHVTKMQLNIIGVRKSDFNKYRCVAKNSLGETDGKIRLYGEDCYPFT